VVELQRRKINGGKSTEQRTRMDTDVKVPRISADQAEMQGHFSLCRAVVSV
jgi:hypothetical protein